MRQRFLILGTFATLATASAACSSTTSTTTSSSASPAVTTGSSTVKIGVAEMLTGSSAFYGNAVLAGIKVGVTKLNSEGGILGKKITLDVQDNASSDAQTTTLIKKLAADPSIGAIIPPTYQPNFLAGCAAANSLQIPIVSAQSGPPNAASNPAGWCYTMTTDPPTQIAATFKYLASKGLKTFVMVYDSQNGYVAFQRPYIEAAAKAGGYNLQEVAVTTGQSDYSPQISKVISESPDAVFPFMVTEDAARFMQQARAQGYSKEFFDPVSQLTSKRLVDLSGGAAVGLVASTPQSAGDIPSFQTFLNEYQKVTGTSLDDPTYTGFGYDAINLIAKAMTSAKTTTDRAAIKRAIDSITNACFSICFTNSGKGAFLAPHFYFVKLTTNGFIPDK